MHPSRLLRRWVGGAALLASLTVATTWGAVAVGSQTGGVALRMPSSDSTQAKIFVDGRLRCDALPCAVDEVPSGDSTIHIDAPGFEHVVLKTRVLDGEVSVLDVVLANRTEN